MFIYIPIPANIYYECKQLILLLNTIKNDKLCT